MLGVLAGSASAGCRPLAWHQPELPVRARDARSRADRGHGARLSGCHAGTAGRRRRRTPTPTSCAPGARPFFFFSGRSVSSHAWARACGHGPEARGARARAQLSKLMGHFQQSTGSSFQGGHDQYDQMAAMASKLTGFPIPASMLRKLCARARPPGPPPVAHRTSRRLFRAEAQPALSARSDACAMQQCMQASPGVSAPCRASAPAGMRCAARRALRGLPSLVLQQMACAPQLLPC